MIRQDFEGIIARENVLTAYIQDIVGLTWDDSRDGVVLKETDELLEWDEYQYVEIHPVEVEDDRIDGILFFGDGTIEFCYEKSREAINFTHHSFEIIDKVIASLAQNLIVY